MKPGYRIWPAAVLAISAAAGVGVLTGLHTGTGNAGCSAGGQWVTMAPLAVSADTQVVASWRAVKYESTLAPILTGCLDIDQVTPVSPADLPDARS